MLSRSYSPALRLVIALFLGAFTPDRACAWRSSLYPATWQAPGLEASFETNKLIQDFSYAGYHAGEDPLPVVSGPVFNVTQAPYNADPTGTNDATVAIQTAINAAKAAGGGIVFLPQGLYSISPQGSANYALRIDGSKVVLRGAGVSQTYLLNTSTNMRDKVVILLQGPSAASFFSSGAGSTTISEDLPGPTKIIPVTSTAGFSAGQFAVVRADASDAWVLEHNEPGWVSYSNSLRGVTYFRKIVAVDNVNKTLLLDSPTRYYLKTRDNARVVRLSTPPITESGVEDFSIGNIQQTGTGWAEEDYNYSTNASYYVHNSFLLKFERSRDSWARRIHTFQAASNTFTCHLLSNGILISESSRVTLSECHFQRPQFGGGGGNGYMYRLQNANDCLLDRSRATFSRHGFVFSHMGSSGNVYYRCIDKDTGKQTGITGSQNTSGANSDHHMWFSHSNLADACTGDNSSFEGRYRPYGSVPYHNVTSAHSVYWNTEGINAGPAYVIRTEQSRYGYAIGTRGTRTGVDLPTFGGTKCNPVDHVEGLAQGATLEPASLYDDQLSRRLGLPSVTMPGLVVLPFPWNSTNLSPTVLIGGLPPAPDAFAASWSIVSSNGPVRFSSTVMLNPQVTFLRRGTNELEVTISANGRQASARVTVVLAPQLNVVTEDIACVADAFVRDGSFATNNYGSDTQIHLKKSSAGFNRLGFVRYDLNAATLTNFNRAWLKLRAANPPVPSAAPTLESRLVTDDNWAETNITWNTQPPLGSILGTWAMSTGGVDRVEVTSSALSEYSGDKLFSATVGITSQPGDAVYYYDSRNNSSGSGPTLVLERVMDPEPYTNWISGFASVPVAERGYAANPDSDRLSNAEEYLFLRNPGQPDVTSVFTWIREPAGWSLRYVTRRYVPGALYYAFESTLSLSPPGWGLVQGVVYTQLSETETSVEWKATLPDSATAPGRFYRMVIGAE